LDFKDILQNVEDLCIPIFHLPLKQRISFEYLKRKNRSSNLFTERLIELCMNLQVGD
jgi:hypothetical protein